MEESGKAIALHERRVRIVHTPEGEPFVDKRLRDVWELHGLKLEGHMASCVEFLLRDDRWTGLKRNDDGHSHHRVLDVYVRMQAESDEGLLCSAQPTWTLIG